MDDGLSRGGARGLRPPLREGPDLPRPPHRQLVRALPHGALRRGGSSSEGGEAGTPLAHPLPGGGRRRRAWSSRPRGPRRCSATPASPCTRRTSATARWSAERVVLPLLERADPGRRRRRWSTRSSAPARSRSRRRTTPTTSRWGSATACRRSCIMNTDGAHERGGRPLRRARPLRGAQAHRRRPRGARPAREDRATTACRSAAASAATP